jgi:hypothetical protein
MKKALLRRISVPNLLVPVLVSLGFALSECFKKKKDKKVLEKMAD